VDAGQSALLPVPATPARRRSRRQPRRPRNGRIARSGGAPPAPGIPGVLTELGSPRGITLINAHPLNRRSRETPTILACDGSNGGVNVLITLPSVAQRAGSYPNCRTPSAAQRWPCSTAMGINRQLARPCVWLLGPQMDKKHVASDPNPPVITWKPRIIAIASHISNPAKRTGNAQLPTIGCSLNHRSMQGSQKGQHGGDLGLQHAPSRIRRSLAGAITRRPEIHLQALTGVHSGASVN
jgi:hypothetical protein